MMHLKISSSFRLIYVVAITGYFSLLWGHSTSNRMYQLDAKAHSKETIKGNGKINVHEANMPHIKDGTFQVGDELLKNLKLYFKQRGLLDSSNEHATTSFEISGAQNSSTLISDEGDIESSQEFIIIPYELVSGFIERKPLAAIDPRVARAQQISRKPREAATKPARPGQKAAKKKSESKKNGPADYMAKWPGLRTKMAAMKKKIRSAHKQLNGPEKALLDRIEQGDDLKKQATHLTDLQRLNHLGRKPNNKSVTELKNTYKNLNQAITELGKKVQEIEKALSQKSVETGVQKLRRELRKQMEFVTPNVDDAISSGWSAITDSLADTTNFEYSVLVDRPAAPVFSIYRFGDGVGEKTYLDEDLRNIQTNIDSLSRHNDIAPDPDLEKVEEVLSDLMNRNRITDAENKMDSIEFDHSPDENDAVLVEDETDDVDMNDEISTMKDGVFYLLDSRNRAKDTVSHGEDVMSDLKIDRGSVTDKTNGGGFDDLSVQSQLRLSNEEEDESPHSGAHDQRSEQVEVIHRNMLGNADSGMTTLKGDSVGDIQRNIYRKTRSVGDRPNAHQSPRKVVKAHILYDDAGDGTIKENVNTLITKQDMSGKKAPKLVRAKSKEDTESYKLVDDTALEKENLKMERKQPEYREQDEVDQTGDEGADVIGLGRRPVAAVDKVYKKEYLAETVDKDNDEEYEDESMQVGSVNNYGANLEDMPIDRDRDLIKAYKTTLNLVLPRGSLRRVDPRYGQINDGLSDDIRLAPGELVELSDNSLYAPDVKYPVTGPNAGREVGSLAYWTRELAGLDDTWNRNNMLAAKVSKSAFSPSDEVVNSNLRGEGDVLFLDSPFRVRKKSSPRVSDLLSRQVWSIIEETKENEGKKVKSDRKRLAPWRNDFDPTAEISVSDEKERRKEDQLEALVNPGLDVMLKRSEEAQAQRLPGVGGQDFSDLNKLVLSLLDDAPVPPEEFDYLKELSNVSLFMQPVKANPAKMKVPRPKDKLTKSALKHLDRAQQTLKDIDEDMKLRQGKQLKKELVHVEKTRQQVKLARAKKKMEQMYDDIKAIAKLDKLNEELRKKRVKQYQHMTQEMENAYKQRQKQKIKDYRHYGKLLKQLRKSKKYTDHLAKFS